MPIPNYGGKLNSPVIFFFFFFFLTSLVPHTGLDFSCPPLLPNPLPLPYPNHHLTITRANSYPSHSTNHYNTSPSSLPRCNYQYPPVVCSPSASHIPPTTSWLPFAPPPSHTLAPTSRASKAPPPSHTPVSTWLSVAPPPGFHSPAMPGAISSASSCPRVAPPPGYTSSPCYPPLPHATPPPPPPSPCSHHQSSVTSGNTSSSLQGTHPPISHSNSTPVLHLLPPNSPDPPRAVLLPAGMERDTHPPPTAALMKPKQTGARPDAELTSSQGVKQVNGVEMGG